DVRDLGHAELVRMASRREGDTRGLDPLGSLLRHALLVDRLALGAVRMPLQLCRPLVQRTDDPVADGDVVLDEVELRLAARAEEDLLRVRHAHGALADLQLDGFRGHGRSIPASRGTILPRRPGEVSEWPKERDWKSRTCRKVRRGFKSRPLRRRTRAPRSGALDVSDADVV